MGLNCCDHPSSHCATHFSLSATLFNKEDVSLVMCSEKVSKVNIPFREVFNVKQMLFPLQNIKSLSVLADVLQSSQTGLMQKWTNFYASISRQDTPPTDQSFASCYFRLASFESVWLKERFFSRVTHFLFLVLTPARSELANYVILLSAGYSATMCKQQIINYQAKVESRQLANPCVPMSHAAAVVWLQSLGTNTFRHVYFFSLSYKLWKSLVSVLSLCGQAMN